MPTNFHLAPPAKTVDGLLAVPIDIESIAAVFTFDGATRTATADATITYTVGPTTGNPIFDLRQVVGRAWLDGAAFPPARLAHHLFGGEPFTDLRVIEAVQAAGSVHTLRVQYALGMPDAELKPGYWPVLKWDPGPRLRFVFGLSDLSKARYAEAWLPANLIFDQFAIGLEIRLLNTPEAHAVITNGSVTDLGPNHWQLAFPPRSSAVSPLVEVRAADTLVRQTDTVLLPVSGAVVAVEAWKPADSGEDLAVQIGAIKTLLADNETGYGAYLHGGRFVAFFNGGGMEYEGGTTTSALALAHETFHSWFARGIKPASQADGWWDEGFTKFHDHGADDAVPFDFTAPPVVLCSRDPWQRATPHNSYDDGSAFWKGMAALLGVAELNALMAALYGRHKGNPVTTEMIEEFLLCRTGRPRVVDAFHRFVYGLPDPAPAPDLYLRADDPAGAFWDSPDLWVRNAEDDLPAHQSPAYGRDNWFYARVRNRPGAGPAAHFVVTFHAPGFAGTEFGFPADFLPCVAARAEFDLAAGDTRVVKARWPRALVPPAGSHTGVLASVLARGDPPAAGTDVGGQNNLAQKNRTVVDLTPASFLILPVVIANWRPEADGRFDLEVRRPPKSAVGVSLIHPERKFFRPARAAAPFRPARPDPGPAPRAARLDCGDHAPGRPGGDPSRFLTSDTPAAVARRFPRGWEVAFADGVRAEMAVVVPPHTQTVVGLRVAIPAEWEKAGLVTVHLVQRHAATGRIVGGVAVQVNVVKRR